MCVIAILMTNGLMIQHCLHWISILDGPVRAAPGRLLKSRRSIFPCHQHRCRFNDTIEDIIPDNSRLLQLNTPKSPTLILNASLACTSQFSIRIWKCLESFEIFSHTRTGFSSERTLVDGHFKSGCRLLSNNPLQLRALNRIMCTHQHSMIRNTRKRNIHGLDAEWVAKLSVSFLDLFNV